ncbi:MAG TPA: hypothetical protein VHB50_12445, partial [Bryobacteraceae bacterium]|nr:hypothetical protein [Bryobacteraceae bacterium]
MNRKPLVVVLTFACLLGVGVAARKSLDLRKQMPDRPDATGAVTLPNGWRITPVGQHLALPGDLPMKMYVTPDGGSLIVNTGGFHDHSVNVIDLKARKSAATLNVVKTWDGMAVDSATGTIFLSGGGHAMRGFMESLKAFTVPSEMKASLDKPILRVRYRDGKLVPAPPLAIAGLAEKDRYISGVALGPDAALYVLNIQTDTLYRLSGDNFAGQTSAKTGYRPYGLAFSPDGKTLAVSNWGD